MTVFASKEHSSDYPRTKGPARKSWGQQDAPHTPQGLLQEATRSTAQLRGGWEPEGRQGWGSQAAHSGFSSEEMGIYVGGKAW